MFVYKMPYMDKFEMLLEEVIDNENSEGFEEFKRKVKERLDEID